MDDSLFCVSARPLDGLSDSKGYCQCASIRSKRSDQSSILQADYICMGICAISSAHLGFLLGKYPGFNLDFLDGFE